MGVRKGGGSQGHGAQGTRPNGHPDELAAGRVPGRAEEVTPDYWPEAKRHLSRVDPVLRKFIKSYPDASLGDRGDAFQTLARAIVGQQLSVKAAQTIWNRFAACAGDVCPQAIAGLTDESLRGCGFSGAKVKYLRDLARHFESGAVKPR